MSRGRETNPIDVELLEECYEKAVSGGGEVTESLSKLVEFARKKEAAAWLNTAEHHSALRVLLADEKPKTRKNVARLLGEIPDVDDQAALIAALRREKTQFVISSLILALGRQEGASVRLAIEEVQENWQNCELPANNEKHRQEILEACRLALLKDEVNDVSLIKPLPLLNVALRAQKGCLPLLETEAKQKGMQEARAREGALNFSKADYEKLFALRCFEEALLPLGTAPLPPTRNDTAVLKEWAKDIAKRLIPFQTFVASCYAPMPIPYRLEWRELPHERRGTLSRALAGALDTTGTLINRPGNYVLEIRLEMKAAHLQMFAKLMQPADRRFAYRKETLPASIAPVTAAGIMRFVGPHMQENARVFDPCCGSGTLLIERDRALPTQALLGVDKDAHAIAAARKNCAAAGLNSHMECIAGDLRRFRVREPFDELYANLPFGVRVGEGKDADALLAALFTRLDEWMNPQGIVLLYTTHRRSVEKLSLRSAWHIQEDWRFTAGGLAPWAVLLKRKKS